jgi:hypothetical protein
VAIVRFKCSRCGLEATRIGYGDRGMTSVDPDVWVELCVAAAEARAGGDPGDPLSVNCPFLQASTGLQASAGVREPAAR